MVDIPLPAYAALVTAIVWAAVSVYTFRTVKAVGPAVFNSCRIAIGFLVLWAVVHASGARTGFNWSGALLLMLSGAAGVFLGDLLRYVATVRLGPRRAVLLTATSSPLVLVFGATFLAETFSPRTIVGIVLMLLGVLNLALFDARAGQERNRYETITGFAWVGLTLGLVAALFQAIGIVLAKLALVDTHDPLHATFLRLAGALVAAVAFTIATGRVRTLRELTARQWFDIAVGTIVGMVGGTILLLFALKHAPAGIVAVFQSLVPVFITLIVWTVTKRTPHRAAIASVIVTMVGLALVSWG